MTALTYLEHVRTRRFLAKEAQQAVREARLDNYAIRSANAPGGGSGRPGGSDLSDLYIRLEEKELNAAKLLLELQNEQAEARKKFWPYRTTRKKRCSWDAILTTRTGGPLQIMHACHYEPSTGYTAKPWAVSRSCIKTSWKLKVVTKWQ